jgi:uncharacterized tellurite resistance protein B-like protein
MPSIQQLKHLINLARVDGDVAEKERKYIINIGQANHLLIAEILPLFTGDHPVDGSKDLTEEQKFNYIFSLVQLMKIDQRLYRNEIQYCAKVASTLGYREEVLFELMLKVKTLDMEKDEMDALRKLTATYLQKK